MAIPTIPSIEEIKERIVSDIAGKINQKVPELPLSFVKVLASALAGMFFLLYQAILWVYKQIFPASADFENLVLLGQIVGITPVAAVSAIILCDIPGTGVQVLAGELFVGSNQVTYRVTTTTVITGGVASDVPLLALSSGDIGNLANGEILDIAQTNLDLTGTAEVVDTSTSGADAESIESYSARVSLRYRTRYITGSPGAYALNGLETPNFVWVGPYADELLPGKVNVYGKVDNQTDGIPTSAQLTELKNYITFDPETGKEYRRAISDTIETLAISRREFDIEIFINAGTPEINANVQEAIENHIDSLEPYIEGVSGSRKNVLTNTDTASEADAAAIPDGAKVTTVTITDVITGLTETNYTFYGGVFGKWRTITFTAVV